MGTQFKFSLYNQEKNARSAQQIGHVPFTYPSLGQSSNKSVCAFMPVSRKKTF